MLKEQVDNKVECLECEQPAQERLNYFTGQFLTARDFSDEQSYHIGKHREHNKYLHGYGTVCGLKVVPHPNPACRNRFVVIEPGLALDCCGREIWVREKVCVDLMKHLAPQNGNPAQQGRHLLISLCYAECKTEFVPALYSECGCDDNGCEANRVRESYEVKAQRVNELPKPRHCEPSGVRLKWTTTINLDKAWRIALDAERKRLYVLNAADPGQITVFDTDHHCLLRSIDIEAFGIDLDIAPAGDFLYVIRHVAGTPGDFFLRVIDVRDLAHPTTINDLPLGSGGRGQSPALQVTVAHDEGKISTLNPITEKVIIWKTDINREVADIEAAKYAEVNTGDNPGSMAASSDGNWLFIGTPDEIKVYDVADKNFISPAIQLSEEPRLLAVSGDGLRFYAVTVPATGAKKIRAFQIDAATTSFQEIGTTGVEIGPDEPIAISVSHSGEWAYVLSKDESDKGFIRAVNGGKFETDPTHAVSEPITAVSSPYDLLLASDNRLLYAAGRGDERGSCGGVSVLKVEEDLCEEIFWRALEGCRECSDDCVLLAAIPNYQDGMFITDRAIDNRIRPLAPSTETLRKVILCALEKGLRGRDGQDGEDGRNGEDGIGLNPDLPKILDIKWVHADNMPWMDFITAASYDANPEEVVQRGADIFTIYFNQEMTGINRQTFEVRIEYPFAQEVQQEVIFLGLYNIFRVHLYGHLVPISGPLRTPNTGENSPWAVTFVPDHHNTRFLQGVLAQAWLGSQPPLNLELPCVHVLLRGDFIWARAGSPDNLEDRILDADNIAGQVGIDRDRGGVISGGRNPSGDLVQGGNFESWFFLEPPEQVILQGLNTTALRTAFMSMFGGMPQPTINLNTASVESLSDLPGISEALARRIISQRKKAPLEKVEDLLNIIGITENVLTKIRDRVTID